MQFDINALNAKPASPSQSGQPLEQTNQLLQEMLEVQRQILSQLQAAAAAQDASARWRSLLARWNEEFPHLPRACRQALPILERAYGAIVSDLVDELQQNEEEGMANDFALQDFLDRYGIRLGQLGNILNLVGPLAEASAQKESSSEQK